MTPLLGGAFDPPHNGHVALAEAAVRHFSLERLIVLVVADPGHKAVYADAEARFRLARAAFPGYDVELDRHPRTIDMLRERGWDDPLFLIGADELADFPDWKEPDAVLELTRLGVATRPGYPHEPLDPEALPRRVGHRDVAEMRRVERAAVKNSHSHSSSSSPTSTSSPVRAPAARRIASSSSSAGGVPMTRNPRSVRYTRNARRVDCGR